MSAKKQLEKEIRDAYIFLRENNNTIPSETLEFIKEAALEKLGQELPISKVVGRSEQLVCDCENPDVDSKNKPLPTCKDCFKPMV